MLWDTTKCGEVSQLLKDGLFSPSQGFLTLIHPRLPQQKEAPALGKPWLIPLKVVYFRDFWS